MSEDVLDNEFVTEVLKGLSELPDDEHYFIGLVINREDGTIHFADNVSDIKPPLLLAIENLVFSKDAGDYIRNLSGIDSNHTRQ